MPEEGFDAAIATNLTAPYYLVGALAPAMAEAGSGAIVNVASMAGQFALPGMSVYGATKAALLFLTKSWAAEYGPQGVRVNAVTVGPTRTPGSAELGEALDALAAQAPAGRVADPPKSPRPSHSWLAMRRASCTAPRCQLMVAALRCDPDELATLTAPSRRGACATTRSRQRR